MPNRRDFLKTAASATAGVFVLPFQATPAKRREVFIGKRRIKTVDVHGHFVFPEELEVVKGTNLARNVNQNGPLVLGPARLDFNDKQGIDVQVLSHQGAWWYGTDRDVAQRLIKIQNEKLAEWCKAHPDRFVGLASVALQHPDLAASNWMMPSRRWIFVGLEFPVMSKARSHRRPSMTRSGRRCRSLVLWSSLIPQALTMSS